jgi:2-polyprenyl-3-methyl-5-hydroxy-6-metoxy-1,4-benzoquinol methylase
MPKRSTAGFFESYAEDFDAIYGSKDTPINRLISKIFRKSMRLRYQKTIEGCLPVEGKSALDIGCGPGHYAVTLARKGIASVWGIDFAPAMIDLARQKAAGAGVDNVCNFFANDFLAYDFGRAFDYAILMGFMDYMAEPRTVIKRALSLTSSRAFFSFPAAEGFLAWQRRLRYRKKCDLYMYHRQDIAELFRGLTFEDISIEQISRDYFVTVYMNKEGDTTD